MIGDEIMYRYNDRVVNAKILYERSIFRAYDISYLTEIDLETEVSGWSLAVSFLDAYTFYDTSDGYNLHGLYPHKEHWI